MDGTVNALESQLKIELPHHRRLNCCGGGQYVGVNGNIPVDKAIN